jgi:hypothetical protein
MGSNGGQTMRQPNVTPPVINCKVISNNGQLMVKRQVKQYPPVHHQPATRSSPIAKIQLFDDRTILNHGQMMLAVCL